MNRKELEILLMELDMFGDRTRRWAVNLRANETITYELTNGGPNSLIFEGVSKELLTAADAYQRAAKSVADILASKEKC